MATYDPKIIQKFADRLYSQATTVIFLYTLFGVFIGAGLAIASQAQAIVILIGAAIFGGLGLAFGIQRAFTLKVQAQNALCLVRTEENTRSVQAPGMVNAPKPVAPDAERFYVANGKEAAGPHDREKLTQLLQRQILNPRSLVCKEGGSQWHELSTVVKTATVLKIS